MKVIAVDEQKIHQLVTIKRKKEQNVSVSVHLMVVSDVALEKDDSDVKVSVIGAVSGIIVSDAFMETINLLVNFISNSVIPEQVKGSID